METLMQINDFLLSITDFVLGWLLNFSSDVVLFVVAGATSAVLAFVRIFTTDQKYLKRCKDDKNRLKELMKEAKKSGDKEALTRYRTTTSMIAVKTMMAEGKPLLWSLLPIALLGIWSFGRIAFHPVQENEIIQVRAEFPASSTGELAHLVPQDGLEVEGSWIQTVQTQPQQGTSTAAATSVATWNVKGQIKETPYVLQFRHNNETVTKDMLVGTNHYSPEMEIYPDKAGFESVTLKLEPVKLFGTVGGIETIYFQPWLVAYLLIAIPFALILRKMFSIY